MRRTMWLFLLMVVVGSSGAAGQAPPADDSPFSKFLFPPELVMGNQEALALTDAQRTTIRDEIRRVQTEFIDRQWKISEEGEKLARLLQAPNVDEKNVLMQVDRILDFEREIKRLQVGLLVRIRNTLTAQQRTRLNELRRAGS
jgi:Spy/CpxP family protein refolding chaperone